MFLDCHPQGATAGPVDHLTTSAIMTDYRTGRPERWVSRCENHECRWVEYTSNSVAALHAQWRHRVGMMREQGVELNLRAMLARVADAMNDGRPTPIAPDWAATTARIPEWCRDVVITAAFQRLSLDPRGSTWGEITAALTPAQILARLRDDRPDPILATLSSAESDLR